MIIAAPDRWWWCFPEECLCAPDARSAWFALLLILSYFQKFYWWQIILLKNFYRGISVSITVGHLRRRGHGFGSRWKSLAHLAAISQKWFASWWESHFRKSILRNDPILKYLTFVKISLSWQLLPRQLITCKRVTQWRIIYYPNLMRR